MDSSVYLTFILPAQLTLHAQEAILSLSDSDKELCEKEGSEADCRATPCKTHSSIASKDVEGIGAPPRRIAFGKPGLRRHHRFRLRPTSIAGASSIRSHCACLQCRRKPRPPLPSLLWRGRGSPPEQLRSPRDWVFQQERSKCQGTGTAATRATQTTLRDPPEKTRPLILPRQSTKLSWALLFGPACFKRTKLGPGLLQRKRARSRRLSAPRRRTARYGRRCVSSARMRALLGCRSTTPTS